MRTAAHVMFILLFLLVGFFGLGPVLLADGIREERLFTAFVVMVLYMFLLFLYWLILKRLGPK
ncbi:DUF6954 family protein [Mesobacillus harenae]|uniref:DUF6954 family protein n=1 Tax=Mesobacillus harenae TaxID=2213203 RepID=UPI001580016B|nr:hypothetical protein [Mesobacillus harenae]